MSQGEDSVSIAWETADDWSTGLVDQWSTQEGNRVQIDVSDDLGASWSLVEEVFEDASDSAVSGYDTLTGKHVWSDQYEWDISSLAPGSYQVRLTAIDGRGNAGDPISSYEFTLTAPALLGDYNGDGSVDSADYVVWRDNLGTSVTQFSGPDGDGDGQVTQLDYNIWRSNYGATRQRSQSRLSDDS